LRKSARRERRRVCGYVLSRHPHIEGLQDDILATRGKKEGGAFGLREKFFREMVLGGSYSGINPLSPVSEKKGGRRSFLRMGLAGGVMSGKGSEVRNRRVQRRGGGGGVE